MMNAIRNLIIAGSTLLIAGQAMAHGRTFVTVDNDFNGRADVYIRGQRVGTIAADSTARFQVQPGTMSVRITTTGGYFLSSSILTVREGGDRRLEVEPAKGKVILNNPTYSQMRVVVGGTVRWIDPWSSIMVPVESGNVHYVAGVREGNIIRMVSSDNLWVLPGQVELQSLRYTPAHHSSGHQLVWGSSWSNDDDHGSDDRRANDDHEHERVARL